MPALLPAIRHLDTDFHFVVLDILKRGTSLSSGKNILK